jgi:hypothetical protein
VVSVRRYHPGQAAIVRSMCAALLACALAAPDPATAQTAAPTYRPSARKVAVLSDPAPSQQLALKYRLPSMFNNYLWVEAGALISYGVDFSASYRRAGEQMGSVLKGAKPAELPMEQASAVELSINLKTARALGVTFPASLLARADRLIE